MINLINDVLNFKNKYRKMELNIVLKQLVDTKGYKFLQNPMIVNILGDYNAFTDFQSSKFIFKTLVSEGYLDKILFLHENQMPIIAENYITELYDKLGLRKDVSLYVINSLLSSLGYDIIMDIKEEVSTNKGIKETSNNYITTGEHLTFKGIEINGNLSDIKKRLEMNGFSFVCEVDNGLVMEGNFAGYSNCEILVLNSLYTNCVWKIVVLLPQCSNWYNLKDDYNKLKEIYTKKYGKPDSYEYFTSPYEEGDGYELTALSSNNCTYLSFYNVSKGDISVSISQDERITLAYEDGINSKLESEARNNQADLDI